MRALNAALIAVLILLGATNRVTHAQHEEGEIVKVGELDVTWNDEGYTYVKLATSEGDIYIELDSVSAPISVENFLQYVDDGFYDDTIFHRVIPAFVVQGGGFTEDMKQKETRKPIKCEWENGLKNIRGSLAMARTSNPDSATSQFYINNVDNQVLDQPRGGAAYAVFGRVVEGIEIVDKIRNSPTGQKNGMGDVPIENILLFSATRVESEDELAKLKGAGYEKRKETGWAAAIERAEKKWAVEVVERRSAMTSDEQFDAAMAYITSEGFDVSQGRKLDSGVWVLDKLPGETDSESPGPENVVMVHYKGYYVDGEKFDDSRKGGNNRPMTYPLNRFIPGFSEGVGTMKKGGKSIIVIPPEHGYGPAGSASIAPNSTLVFIVDLIDYKDPR